MITRNEILNGEECPEEYEENLKTLLDKANKLRTLWGKPMTITSGYRDFRNHTRIYKDKGVITQAEADLYIKLHDSNQPIPNCKIPTKSKHLYCLAIDVSDPSFKLTEFCRQHPKEMEEIDIYFEDDTSVKRLHIQATPPASKSRWFKP